MFTPRPGIMRDVFFAGLCTLAAGCQSTTSAASLFHRNEAAGIAKTSDQSQFLLRPGTEVQWQVQTAQEQAGQVKTGSGIVAPDGTVEVGPYGTCKLAGLSLTQATTALEKHLAAYMNAPSVQLSATVVDNTTNPAARPTVAKSQPSFFHHRSTNSADAVAEAPNDADIQTVTWRPAQAGAR